MQSEPTAIVEAVRIVAILAATFGIAISDEDQGALVLAIGAIVSLVSIGLAWYNRRKVYAKATVERIATAATFQAPGSSVEAIVGEPPKGEPAAG